MDAEPAVNVPHFEGIFARAITANALFLAVRRNPRLLAPDVAIDTVAAEIVDERTVLELHRYNKESVWPVRSESFHPCSRRAPIDRCHPTGEFPVIRFAT
jgi:hypothetical protein